MDTANDPIKALIETTGLSCDDLLQKLLEYKNLQNKENDQKGKTATSDNSTENGIDKHVEFTPAISENTCTSSYPDNPETTIDNNSDEQKNPLNSRKEDPSKNKNHHNQVPEVLEKSNTSSRPEDTTTKNASSADEDKKENSRIDLKNTPNPIHGDLDAVLSKPIEIFENMKECQNEIGTNYAETTLEADDGHDKQKNFINGCNEDLQVPEVLEESDTFSTPEDRTTENVSSVDEYDKVNSKIDLPNTSDEMQRNLNAPLPQAIDIPENAKECEKVVNYTETISNDCNKDLSINKSHQTQLPQILEETNTLPRPEDTTTANVSSAYEHVKVISRTDLQNTIEIGENLKTLSLKPSDISENNKECQKKIEASKVSDPHSEHQEIVTKESTLINSPLPSVKNILPLDCKENFQSQSEEENRNKVDRNLCVSSNDLQIENGLTPTLRCESNPDTNDTISKHNPVHSSKTRRSISDELVQKFSEILKQDDQISNRTKEPKGNDIEVCQIEDIEVAVKPLLKLRSDLFATNSKGNFTASDNEDENEDNSPELKEFLKNVEEVTGEVEDQPSTECPPTITCKEVVQLNPPRVRKVKMGFLKKRILHNAIKCMNGVDARNSKHLKHNKRMLVPEKLNCENEIANGNHCSEEEIRENLKLQLTSLRNRKKGSLIKDKCNIDNLIINYDKHTFDKKKAPNSITNVTVLLESSKTIEDKPQNPLPNRTDDASKNDIDSDVTEMKESLFSLSNDTDFMIVDVQGGVEFSDISETTKKIDNPPADLIKLTKTNDVTKIKGWQNKKFQLDPEANTNEFQKETTLESQNDFQSDTSMPSCSTPKIIEGVETGTKEELSPFVSNSLEEFLTENSTLNISYNIPKLGAVQGITNQRYNTVIIPQSIEPAGSESEKKEEFEKPKTIKPKTLAEKRRMLENTKLKNVVNEKDMFNKESYVLYNGKKLYVPTMNSEKCLVNIKYAPKSNIQRGRTKQIIKYKKLSLMGTYYQTSTGVSYKAGPLREKFRLQNKESMSQWDTAIRRLPLIKLNVVSEVGKPIPQHLTHHFNFGPTIKEDRLELALSALFVKSGEKEKLGFSLRVPYHNNQKYVLVRKRKEIPYDGVYDITPEKNTIGSVLDDIISYVEHKENENLIIKDAELYEETEKHLTEPNEARTSPDVSYMKKAKRRKLDSELLRLSCKVLSVNVDETEEDIHTCCKSFCKLGCVCKSLACFPPLPMHCSKLECMFECKCSVSEKISLGVETGALTHDTVTRLEDQAKKNLARVEKEFTQTIIHANDKTILIPSSDRSKTKRVKRMPKRYSDFLEDFDVDHKVNSWNDNEDNHSKKNLNCYIQLQNLDIKGIIPLCLYHDCYNCACMNKPAEKSTPENKSLELTQSRIDKKRKSSDVEKKKTVSKELKIIKGVSNSEHNTSDSDHMQEIIVHEGRKPKEKMGCARTLGVHPEILARNEIPFYKNKIKSKVIQAASSTFFDTTSLQNMTYNEQLTEFIDVTTPLHVQASDRLKLFIMKSQPRKRKQTFDDVDPIYKSKKLKRQEVHNEPANKAPEDNKVMNNLPYTPVFNGEIIVPTNENRDFVKKLGVKSAAQYMRLLPWNDLLKNYYTRKINIWCPNDNYNKLLINTSEIGPPQGYIEITKSKRKNGIMNWILTKELPKQTPSELVHLILSPKEEYFEISGICLKNITEEEKAKKIIEMKKIEKTDWEPPIVADDNKHSDDSIFFEHKNHNNETRLLIMTEKEYKKQYLCIHSNSEQMNNEQFSHLYVGLPTFESLRWRMLFLNSNFTFLSFMKSDYSIKYTDLKNVLKKAQLSQKTICLQSKFLSQGYSQSNYGIYAVPKFIDILFIGPYELNEEHGLKTLRYLRQELVSTDYFEMVQGGVIKNKKIDMWLIPKDFPNRLNKTSSPKKKNKSPCSLLKSTAGKSKEIAENSEYAVLTPLPNSSTNPSRENRTSDSECKNDTAQELHNFHSHLFDASGNFATSMDLDDKTFVKFPQFIILNGKTLRPQDFNRYLISNIPDFGYLGAIKNEVTNEIDVNWPFGNKVLRFANVAYARQFIKRRFSNLLLPVPVTFDIQIILKNDLENMDDMTLINPKVLNGTHICGSFGILDSRKLTPCLAQNLGTTQEDVLQRLAKRAQFLGGLEIEKLKAQEKVLISTKKELIMKKQRHLKKYMDLLMTLPEEQRLEVYTKFRREFDGIATNDADINIPSVSPKKSEVVECIDIGDSGSEESESLEMEQTTNVIENSGQKEMVMQSILKPNMLPQSSPSTSAEIESSRPVENFKLVKSSTGKLVLMKDNSGASLSRTLTGMKMKIKNNKVKRDTI